MGGYSNLLTSEMPAAAIKHEEVTVVINKADIIVSLSEEMFEDVVIRRLK